MKPVPKDPRKAFDKDMKTFDQLTAKTKELDILKDSAEKAIGPENGVINKTIRDQSK